MKQIYHFCDQLADMDYIQCDDGTHTNRCSRDHIPTKALLNPPFPENLMRVEMCEQCNRGFSKDEEYFAAFLASAISGSTEPDPLRFPMAARTLDRNPRLRGRIDAGRRKGVTPNGDPEVTWIPELERIERVIVKNARGRLLFELGQTVELPPARVNVLPRDLLPPDQLSQFENPQGSCGWPEVGSRLMLRLLETGEMRTGGWTDVQSGTYRYAVDDISRVRMVFLEYLSAEVIWEV